MKKILITTSTFVQYNTAPLDAISKRDMGSAMSSYGKKLTEDE